MNMPTTLNLPPSASKDPVWKRFRKTFELTVRAVNGNIEFGNPTSGAGNINGVWKSVTTPVAPNTDFVVTHNLGRVAVGYIVMTKDRAVDVYTSPTANPNPTTQIILRATVASAVITLFLL